MSFAQIDGKGVWRPEITPELLIASGYSRFTNSPLDRDKPTYVASYQKRFADNKGTRYFITFTEHDIQDAHHDMRSMEGDVYLKRNGLDFMVETLQSFNATLTTVESLALDLWTALRCDYYERDDGGDERQQANEIS